MGCLQCQFWILIVQKQMENAMKRIRKWFGVQGFGV